MCLQSRISRRRCWSTDLLSYSLFLSHCGCLCLLNTCLQLCLQQPSLLLRQHIVTFAISQQNRQLTAFCCLSSFSLSFLLFISSNSLLTFLSASSSSSSFLRFPASFCLCRSAICAASSACEENLNYHFAEFCP